MKKIIAYLTIAFSVALALPASAQNNQCVVDLRTAVRTCASSGLSDPSLKACVAQAQQQFEGCRDRNQCQIGCDAAYDFNVSTCNSTYDPAICGGNLSCEAFVTAQRAACLSASIDVLNACRATCPTKPGSGPKR
jgi:hypothetical protein